MNLNNSKIPAIVLGGGITALGVVRSLAKYKIPTFLISSRSEYVGYSRGVTQIKCDLNEFPSPDELSTILNRLDLEKSVLFPCSDSLLNSVVNLPDNINSRYLTSLPSRKVVQLMTNKDEFANALIESNIPHPQTEMIKNEDQIRVNSDKISANFFLKPCNSKEFFSQFHVKAFNVKNEQDALNKYRESQKFGLNLLLQEYIPGSSDQHFFVDGFVDRNIEIKSLFARQRIRIYPPVYGNSSYCISISLEEVFPTKKYLELIFNRIGYRGIFSAEFKFDKRDNEFKLLEINARPWWYVGFATHCGINTCIQSYYDAQNIHVESINDYKTDIGCMHSYNDLYSFKLKSKKWNSIFVWLWQYFTSFKPLFSWNDPLPAIQEFKVKLYNYIKKRI